MLGWKILFRDDRGFRVARKCLKTGEYVAKFSSRGFFMEKSDRINVALKETNMKKCVVFMAAVVLTSLLPFRVSAQVAINETHFPDSVFRAYVQENFDTDQDGSLSESECDSVRSIDVSGEDGSPTPSPLSNLSGIEYFPNLDSLFCRWTGLTSLDVSGNPALRYLDCDNTGLTSLDVSQNPALEYLDCGATGITSLDVSQNPALKSLWCWHVGLTSLDVSRNPALEILYCQSTGLTSLDVSQNPALVNLYCHYSTGLTSLDVSRNPALEMVQCQHTGLTSLDVSQTPTLTNLFCYSTGITSLDVSQNPALLLLSCSNTGLTSLDVSQNPALSYLECGNTGITGLDVSQNPVLNYLYCDYTGITSLDVSQNPMLEVLECGNTGITSLDVSQNPNLTSLDCSNARLSHIDLSQNPLMEEVNVGNNVHPVKVSVGEMYDLAQIPGFDLSRVDWMRTEEMDGSRLLFARQTIAYNYDIRVGGESKYMMFKLEAVPDLAAEGQSEPMPFRAWTESGQLHLEGAEGIVEVFDLGGRCLYRGQSSVIPLPGSGIYLVRNQGRSQKVVNL